MQPCGEYSWSYDYFSLQRLTWWHTGAIEPYGSCLVFVSCHCPSQISLTFQAGRLLILALDHILLRALYNLGELFARLRIVLEQVILDQTLGCLAHPLEEGEVLELIWEIVSSRS